MVLAREDRAECVERIGFYAFRQLFRSPRVTNLAFCAVTVAFGQQDPRERKLPLGADRLAAREAPNGRGVAPILPQPRFHPSAQQAHARPV